MTPEDEGPVVGTAPRNERAQETEGIWIAGRRAYSGLVLYRRVQTTENREVLA